MNKKTTPGSFHQHLHQVIGDITTGYQTVDFLHASDCGRLPNRNEIISTIKDLRKLLFPGYFGTEAMGDDEAEYYVGHLLVQIHENLTKQIFAAITYHKPCEDKDALLEQAETHSSTFISKLGHIQSMLMKDVQAAYDGDPAAHSKEEIIFCYPGLLAIFVYRIAHELYEMEVPFIPRIMTEYAHSRTGIDINPGATIGEYFFIDHGTGVVIGETTIIGNNVKVYQGVTLGALSTRSGQLLSGVKRHPTIEDNVTIYSSASILGGETVIGADSIIGGNAFIVESVPPSTRVSVKNPELTFTNKKESSAKPDSILHIETKLRELVANKI